MSTALEKLLEIPAMSTRTVPRWLKMALSVLILIALITYGLRAWRRWAAEEHYKFASPDGRFEIVVYRMPSLGFAMPGQGSDAPGYFQLRETRTGRVLREQDVEMVQLVRRIHWSPTDVDVGLLAKWSLPQ
jgi:hypothetical protein